MLRSSCGVNQFKGGPEFIYLFKIYSKLPIFRQFKEHFTKFIGLLKQLKIRL